MATLLASNPMLTIGPVQALAQNTIYAMPARACKGFTDVAALEGNLVNSATGMAAITVTAGEFTTAAPFIRCTTSAATVRLVAL